MEVSYGYCHCGCGQKTQTAEVTRRDRGWIRGLPKLYLKGHGNRKSDKGPCSENGCENPVMARGMCRLHYQRWQKTLDPERYRAYARTFAAKNADRRREQALARYKADPAKHVRYSRRSTVKRKYGLTLEQYDAILARGCAICGRHEPRLALDHCHKTGRIRDALCANCNRGIGLFADEPGRLRAAAEYLESHS